MSACTACYNSEFIELVRQSVAGELAAVTMYTEMANMVDNLTLKIILAMIAGDEFAHARTWMTILAMCGFTA